MKNIEKLLEKYWEAETTLEEENRLHAYFNSEQVAQDHLVYQPLFNTFKDQKSVTFSGDVASIIGSIEEDEAGSTVSKQAKVFSIRRYLPAVAAASVLVFGFVMGFNWLNQNNTPTPHQNVVVLDEEAEAQEAYRVTREALALLSSNYNKGNAAIQELGHLKRANQLIN